LAKLDEISSTEKLLNVIRGKTGKPAAPPDEKPAQADSKSARTGLIKVLSFKKKLTVGLDIGPTELKLVAIEEFGDKPQLADYIRIPYEPEVDKSSPEFSRFLRSALADFCGSAKNIGLWGIISSARVETRYIRIPKVPNNQIANAVYWTYKKEVNFNDNNDIFDFELLGEVDENGARRLAVIAYSAPNNEVQTLKNIILKTGYPLTGISIVPFAVQNLLRKKWMAAESDHICSLFVGSDWSRIAIFSEGDLVLSRDIKSGEQSMVEAIREAISSPDTESEDSGSVMGGGEKQAYYDAGAAQNIFNHFIQRAPVSHDPDKSVPSAEETFEMITPALERIVRQVERTLQHFSINFKNEVIDKVYISGETSTNHRIRDYIGEQLGLPIEVTDPFSDEISIAGQVAIPESLSERGAFVPAMGIALSNNENTPNFIHTYEDKARMAMAERFSRLVLGGAGLLILLCIGAYFWQSRIIELKKVQRDQLQRQVDRFIPYVDQNLILQMVTQVQMGRLNLEQNSRKYLGMALIGVVTNRTPDNIRLLSMTTDLGQIPGKKNEKVSKTLKLEGIISGERLAFESTLAEYLLQLKKVPLFGQAKVQSKTVDLVEDREVMRFTAQLELI
jgi:type IV pilus assembly protein PilM